jgi:hypothetical protein
MENKNKLLDDLLKNLENAIGVMRGTLKSGLPLDSLINQFKPQIEKILEFLSLIQQDQELEQRRQVLDCIAYFIQEKVNKTNTSLEIIQSAVYFICKEEDSRLRIEENPSEETQSVISATKECLIFVKVNYEKLAVKESWLRKIEIFYNPNNTNEQKFSVKISEEEISWDSLPQDIREASIKEGKSKISFQVYPPSK